MKDNKLGAINGTLTSAINATTKQSSPSIQVPSNAAMTAMPQMQPGPLTTGKTTKGKVVREAGEEKGSKKKPKDEEEPEEPKASSIVPKDPDAVETAEDEVETEPSEPDQLDADKTEEETLFDQTLKGQTIKSSDLQLDVNGGKLVLMLVSSANPFELEWHNNRKSII